MMFLIAVACVLFLEVRCSVAQSSNSKEVLLNVFKTDEHLRIAIKNTSKFSLAQVEVFVATSEFSVTKKLYSEIGPDTLEIVKIPVQDLKLDDLGAVSIRVSYQTQGRVYEILQAAGFTPPDAGDYPESCTLPVLRLVGGREIRFIVPPGLNAELVLPSFVRVISSRNGSNSRTMFLEPKRRSYEQRADFFMIYRAGVGKADKVCSSSVTLPPDAKASSIFGLTFFCIVAVFSYVASLVVVRFKLVNEAIANSQGGVWIVVARYLGTLFNVSALLALSRIGPYFADSLVLVFYKLDPSFSGSIFHGLFRAVWHLAEWFRFDGKDYDYFFAKVADPFFFYVLILNPLVLFFLIKPSGERDKYYHLLLKTLSPFLGKGWVERYRFQAKKAHVASLALGVKFFYVPLLASWAVNNVYHQNNLYLRFHWNFAQVNEFLVAFFIFLDVFIFALSYFTELPQLKNEVRSVEPTMLGWVVCLMCYPPFNKFSFSLFDVGWGLDWQLEDGYIKNCIFVLISMLWLIYLSASIALGWKASNLTNRGIIKSGPYRYVRHPAYISKLCVWMLGGVFLGERTFGYMTALVTVYLLRALTEERHLSADPEYLEYCRVTPYRFIPGVV